MEASAPKAKTCVRCAERATKGGERHAHGTLLLLDEKKLV